MQRSIRLLAIGAAATRPVERIEPAAGRARNRPVELTQSPVGLAGG